MARRKPAVDGERFHCPFPGCAKSYTRADHLSRHQLNHGGSSKTLQCDQCDRTFVRPDLLARHQQRHIQWQRSGSASADNSTAATSLHRILNRDKDDTMDDDGDELSSGAEDSHQPPRKVPRLNSHLQPGDGLHPQHFTLSTSAAPGPAPATSSTSQIATAPAIAPRNGPTAAPDVATTTFPPLFDDWPDLDDINASAGAQPAPPLSGHQTPSMAGLHGLAPSTANFSDFSWLFDGIEPSFTTGAASIARSDHTNSVSAWSMSPDALYLQPTTNDLENLDEIGELQRAIEKVPTDEASYNIEPVAHHRLLVFLQAIPELLKSPFFTPQALRLYLHLFFTRFNTVYPMIHQPTFSASSTDPSLLASAIMIGTYFSVPSAYDLAVRIAQKMWSAMLNLDDFRPTRATLPMLQAMVLTEFFAKTMATRPQHEMAHLFHSFMVTLARRNALFIGPHRSQTGQGAGAWRTWAREEERKRVTFFLFILDSAHATVFGHAPVVSAFEIHLYLPCSHVEWTAPTVEAWESVRRSITAPPRLFIAAVKARLTRGSAPGQPPTDSFTRLLVLHGLMSVGFDLKWKQHSLLESVDEEGLSSWQEKVRVACSSLREACEGPAADATDEVSSMLISTTQMILYVDVLDIMTAAGQPAVLGRVIDRDSYRASQQTIHRWSQSRQGPIAVWHAVHFLRSSLRNRRAAQEPEGKFRGGRLEETLHRYWCEYLAVLVVWAYGYTTRPKTDVDRPTSGTGHLASSPARHSSHRSDHRSSPWVETAMPLQGPYYDSMARRSELDDFLDSMCTRRPQDIVSSPWKSCTRPVLEAVERNLRTARWDLAQEAADLLQRLVQHHSAAMPPRTSGFGIV